MSDKDVQNGEVIENDIVYLFYQKHLVNKSEKSGLNLHSILAKQCNWFP